MPVSLSNSVLNTMRAKGWIESLTKRPPATAPARAALEGNREQKPSFFVGTDLGGTKVHSAGLLLAPGSEPILVESFEETDPRGGLDLVQQLGRIAHELLRRAHAEYGGTASGLSSATPSASLGSASASSPLRITSFALGCPGVVDPATGFISLAPNLPGWDALNVPEALATELNCPIQIDNDVNIAARGEQVWTASDDLAFISLGTGIGMGLILAGRVHVGASAQAGEICHLPLGSDPYDRSLQCHGILESRLSGTGLLADHASRGGQGADVREIFELAASGETAAQATLQATADLLALTVRTVAAVVDPRLFVLGGGIGSRPEILALTRDSLSRTAGGRVNVRSSAFGSRAGVAGALAAALTAVTSELLR